MRIVMPQGWICVIFDAGFAGNQWSINKIRTGRSDQIGPFQQSLMRMVPDGKLLVVRTKKLESILVPDATIEHFRIHENDVVLYLEDDYPNETSPRLG